MVCAPSVSAKEHSATLACMNNLADALGGLGKKDEGEKLHPQSVDISTRVLGKEHPRTLEFMASLATFLLENQGKKEEATQLREEVKQIRLARKTAAANTQPAVR
jgi:hypothetical protein